MVSVIRLCFLALILPIFVTFTLFMVPYLFYASYSIGVPNATPTELFPYSAFEMVHQTTSACDMDTSSHCCIYIGPIIGKTTSFSSRFLIELTQDVKLGITLTPISPKTSPNNNSNQPLLTTIPIKAKTPTIVELDSLYPDTIYTISFNNCAHPLAEQPEGGHGLIKTLPLFWSDDKLPKIAVVSCNSINIRNRDRKILDQTVKPTNFSLSTFLNSSNEQKQEFLKNPLILSYLARITDMWTSLYTQSDTLHYLFHLGDSVYQDSKHDGGDENNQFVLSQQLIFKYLEDVWDYQEAYNAGKMELANEILKTRLPSDTPTDVTFINQIYTQRFTSINDAFSKWVQNYHRVSQIIPVSIRNAIYQIYKKQYIKTYALSSTRYVLSRVANLFIWDDHDVFDDSNDCPADTDTLSLRRLIFDIGLAAYLPYQHSLNLDNTPKSTESQHHHSQPHKNSINEVTNFIPTPPLHEVSYQPNLLGSGLQLDGINIQAYSMTYDKHVITIPPIDSPKLSVVTPGMHHFHMLSDGLCFVFIDTRSARHFGAFNADAFDDYSQDPTHEANPYLLLGQKQWADLESFLFTQSVHSSTGVSKCSALIVANSMPVQFMQSSPNHLVALFHDDMYGHWSSLEFEKEQVRLFRLFTNWREQQQVQNKHEKAQVYFLGGDVHSIGYTSIYPHQYHNSSLSSSYLLNKQQSNFHQLSSKASSTTTLHDSYLEPLHSLTVSPIQQEGLDALWLYSLVGFQHSYPLISNNNDVLPITHNGFFHTLLNSYSKIMMYSEQYLGQVLPQPIFRIIFAVVSFMNRSVAQISAQCFVGYQFASSMLTPQTQQFLYSSSGHKLEPILKKNKADKSTPSPSITEEDKALARRDDPYYFGYKHYSWINTPGYAVLTVYFPSDASTPIKSSSSNSTVSNLPAKHVCIQSQVFALARPLEPELFSQLYHYYLHLAGAKLAKSNGEHFQQKPHYHNNNDDQHAKKIDFLMPTLWAEYPKHNTTGFGC